MLIRSPVRFPIEFCQCWRLTVAQGTVTGRTSAFHFVLTLTEMCSIRATFVQGVSGNHSSRIERVAPALRFPDTHTFVVRLFAGEIIILGRFRGSNHLDQSNPSAVAPARPDTHHHDLLAMLTPNVFVVWFSLSDSRGGGILRRGTRRRGHRSTTQVCFPFTPIVRTQALTPLLCAHSMQSSVLLCISTLLDGGNHYCVFASRSQNVDLPCPQPLNPCTPLHTEDRHFAIDFCDSQDDRIERSRRHAGFRVDCDHTSLRRVFAFRASGKVRSTPFERTQLFNYRLFPTTHSWVSFSGAHTSFPKYLAGFQAPRLRSSEPCLPRYGHTLTPIPYTSHDHRFEFVCRIQR